MCPQPRLTPAPPVTRLAGFAVAHKAAASLRLLQRTGRPGPKSALHQRTSSNSLYMCRSPTPAPPFISHPQIQAALGFPIGRGRSLGRNTTTPTWDCNAGLRVTEGQGSLQKRERKVAGPHAVGRAAPSRWPRRGGRAPALLGEPPLGPTQQSRRGPDEARAAPLHPAAP